MDKIIPVSTSIARLDESHFGLGVFANQDIKRNGYILTLSGPTLKESETLTDEFINSHSIQVSADTYLGPAGNIHDYLNHSCDPNAGLNKSSQSGEIILKAMRDIRKDEEITFDYSTCIEDDWTLQCACANISCRGVVGRWSKLPERIKSRYRFEGVALADTF